MKRQRSILYLLLSLFLACSIPCFANSGFSPAFLLNTQKLIRSSASGISGTFNLNTITLIHSMATGVSGAFVLDTRGIQRIWREAVSDSFVLDTRSARASQLMVAPVECTDFGAVQVGSTSTARQFIITNGGSSTVSGVATSAAPFGIVGSSNYTLAPGKSVTIQVIYQPTAVKDDSAYLILTLGGDITGRQMIGRGYSAPVSTGWIQGYVTDYAMGTPVAKAIVTSDASRATTDRNGWYRIDGLAPGANYTVCVVDDQDLFEPAKETGLVVRSGKATSLNFALTRKKVTFTPTVYDIPIVLIRGRGNSIAWSAGESDYWSTFRDKLSRVYGFKNVWDCNNPEPGLTNSGYVISGERGIETNAYRLRTYISEKMQQYAGAHNGTKPPKITIIAHSMGGLITRQFLTQNLKDKLVPVDKVIMLSTPNAGSVLADVFHWPLSWDSTLNLRTSYIREDFSSGVSWDYHSKLFMFAGTNPLSALDPYYSAGSAVIVANSCPLDWINDGAVTKNSSFGRYYDVVAGLIPVRQDAFVDGYPRREMPGVALDHTQIHQDSGVLSSINQILLGNIKTSSLRQGGFERQMLLDDETTTPTQQIDLWSGISKPAQTITSNFPVNGFSNLMVIGRWQLDDMSFKLLTPDGRTINPSTSTTDPNVTYTLFKDTETSPRLAMYQIKSPMKGIWSVTLKRNATQTMNVEAGWSSFEDSTIAFIPINKSFAHIGESVILQGSLYDGRNGQNKPILGASVVAAIVKPNAAKRTVQLYDDGLHFDNLNGDGIYGGEFKDTTLAGEYAITYRADALDAANCILRRAATRSVSVSSGNAYIASGLTCAALDIDADKITDKIRANCRVNLKSAGDYVLSADLVDAAHNLTLHAAEPLNALPSGSFVVSLFFDRQAIGMSGVYGPWSLQNLQLFQRVNGQLQWVDQYSQDYTVNITLPGNGSNTKAEQWADYK